LPLPRAKAETRDPKLSTSFHPGLHLPLELLQPSGEQHKTVGLQGWPATMQVAAWAGVGATIEVITGSATAAATPRVRTIWRRDFCRGDIAGYGCARTMDGSSKWNFSS
jgi:hypothetical protein